MKTRRGFVSNSSSSSFVVVGIDLTSEEYDKVEATFADYYDYGYILLDGSDDGVNENQLVFGKLIAKDEDGYMESVEISIEEVERVGREIIERLGNNIGSNKKPKIYCGTRAC